LGALAEHSSFTSIAHGGIDGVPHENGVARQGLTHEYFVVKFDGLVTSGHRRFVDALKAGLLLRDQFPQHKVKVDAIQVSESIVDRLLH
jgi:hypothetical protein